MNNNYDFLFWLGVVANCCQIESYQILLSDFNNHDLMRFLQHQDDLMQKIINQNDEIIKLLKEGSTNA